MVTASAGPAEHMPTRGATGRADLLEAWATGGQHGVTRMARLLGYDERRARVSDAPAKRTEIEVPVATSADRDAEADAPLAPVAFWRLQAIEHQDPEPAPGEPVPDVLPIGVEGIGRLPGQQPETPPIVPDARLWPALHRLLASEVPSRDVDVEALLDRWTRGRAVAELPRRRLRAWSSRVRVLVDRSERLIPFWDDQDHVVRMLEKRLGASAIEEILYFEGEHRPWRSRRHATTRPPADEAIPLLALSDLGFLAGPGEQRQWARTGQDLRRLGARAAAIVPCPAGRWQATSARAWNAVDWSRPTRAPLVSRPPDGEALRRRAERVLARLAFAARLEPGLVRTVRQLLPAGDADIGTEADVWAHPEVAGGFAAAADLAPELRRRLQRRFAEIDDASKAGVVSAMRAWRAGMPGEIWLDEVLALHLGAALPDGVLSGAEIEAAFELWRRIAETVDGEARPSEEASRGVKSFARRTIRDRQPGAAWQHPKLAPLLWRAWQASWDGEGAAPLPAAGDPSLIGGGERPAAWAAWQVGDRLRFLRRGEVSASGSPLAQFESANATVTLLTPAVRFAHGLPLSQEAPLPVPAMSVLSLRTDRTHATLRRITRPAWASAMGRDRWGLWASFEVEGVEQRLRWIPPGRFMMGSPEDEPGRFSDEGPRHLEVIEHGFWMADTPCTQAMWTAVMGDDPSHFSVLKRPVEQVSWEDAKRFLEKVNERIEGLDARLPLEVEWEYACRAGTTTATYAGPIEIGDDGRSVQLEKLAWYRNNSGGETHAVAQMPPNPWRLYDMLGNVDEWCEDRWRSNYNSEADPQGAGRVVRGGSWLSSARDVRAACRNPLLPSDRGGSLGFRLARGQGALRRAEREVLRAEPVSGGAERRGSDERGTRRRSRPSRPEAANE